MPQRSPQLVALLSLLVPGLGQAVLGRRQRGLLLFVSALVLAALLLVLDTSRVGLLALLPFWAVNVWDAYRLGMQRLPPSGLLLLTGVLPIYLIGWQVTSIDVARLLSNANRVQPLVAGLFQPSVIEQEQTVTRATQPFYVPCPLPADAAPSEDAPGGPSLQLSVACGEIGEPLTLTATGFPPNQSVTLWWVNPVEAQSRVRVFGAYEDFRVDESGGFTAEIEVPNAIPIRADRLAERHQIEVRYVSAVGGWKVTETAQLVLQRMGETIAQALMATLAGAILAMPFSFFGARNLMAGNPLLVVLYYICRAVMNVLRSVEPLIMAIVFVVWVGLGPFAGVLALMVHTIAALGKLYSESIESIDEGPIEAIRSTGANQLQIIAYGVVPQILPPWIAFTVYRWDINVRMSTIIGFVGGGGIGFLLSQWIRLQDFRAAGAAIWAIALVVILLDTLSARVRERIV